MVVRCSSDPRLLEDWVERDDGIANSIMTLFPCLNLQQSLNTVAIRQMVPRGPFESELFWTLLGFEEDDERKTRIRLRQSKSVQAVGADLAGGWRHRGIRTEGDPWRTRADHDHRKGRARARLPPKTRTTETSVRGFWRTYRRFMNL
jgi:anthranilate 1,2-dioxygenase large subunit/terephthalate 1,2-dioxygenase oxygenase component alpha subunit